MLTSGAVEAAAEAAPSSDVTYQISGRDDTGGYWHTPILPVSAFTALIRCKGRYRAGGLKLG